MLNKYSDSDSDSIYLSVINVTFNYYTCLLFNHVSLFLCHVSIIVFI